MTREVQSDKNRTGERECANDRQAILRSLVEAKNSHFTYSVSFTNAATYCPATCQTSWRDFADYIPDEETEQAAPEGGHKTSEESKHCIPLVAMSRELHQRTTHGIQSQG